MIEPKEITIKTQKGEERTYTISKFPAVAGREIVAKYPISAMPKLGDYAVNEETMMKLMAYVAIKTDGGPLPLTTRALIDNHVPDWEVLARIEMNMMEYNCSFFGKGGASIFEGFAKNVKSLATRILTDSSVQSFLKGKQPTKN